MGKKDKKNRQPVPSPVDIIKFVFMIAGMILIVFAVVLYRKTIIAPAIPVGITLSVTCIAFLARKKEAAGMPVFRGYFLAFMSALIFWGFLACYALMAINYYAAENRIQHYTFKIEERGSLVGPKRHRERRSPTVTINYFGFEKELVFPYEDTQEVKAAQNVKLFVRRGYLGYDIIERKEVY
jgi:hypothetical protein